MSDTTLTDIDGDDPDMSVGIAVKGRCVRLHIDAEGGNVWADMRPVEARAIAAALLAAAEETER